MRRVRRGAKRRFPLELFLVVFLISFILLAFVYFFIFSFSEKSDFGDLFFGVERSANIKKVLDKIGSTLADGGHGGRPSADATVYLHAPSSGIVPGFGKGFIDLPITKLDLYPVATIRRAQEPRLL